MIKVRAGRYAVHGADGNTYHIEREYGVGVTVRGWAAYRQDGTRWAGTRFSGQTMREVVRQMREAGVVKQRG